MCKLKDSKVYANVATFIIYKITHSQNRKLNTELALVMIIVTNRK